MKVRELGEFGLIDRLAGLLAGQRDDDLIVGIGDDAAVWRTGDACTIGTTDTMVAGVHFLPDAADWRDVGWKSIASNVSDIAAMGGSPQFALVTLCVPPDLPVARLESLYEGMRDCASAYGVTIAGGDVVASPDFIVTVALTGVAETRDGEPALLLRSAGRPGDAVAVTGPLGGSAGGLRVLRDGAARTAATDRLAARHMRPRPRVDAGRAAVAAGIRCGMDISDGLVQDLGHICERSGVAADLWLARLPLDDDLVAVYPDDATLLAATGGEDYELILVGEERQLERVGVMLDAPLTVVGTLREGKPGVRALDASMREVRLPAGGWEHLGRER